MTNKKIKDFKREDKEQPSLTLYEVNKQIIEQEGAMKEEDIKTAFANGGLVSTFFSKNFASLGEQHWYMLLCYEKRDFTVFDIYFELSSCFANAVESLQECIQNRGSLYSIEKDTSGQDALEIWIKDSETGELNCYYLFNYDEGVIEIG
jgi:hypothetical protein